MIRELFIPVAEALFWLTGGELLINTFWFFLWVIGGAVLMVIPFYLALITARNKSTSWPALVFIIGFFPTLLLITSPGIIQAQLMEECRIASAEVTIEGVTETQTIRLCRFKDNFYDTEYGPWKQSNNG
jgi:hypothetical protein